MKPLAQYLTQSAARRACDMCGEDTPELRLFTFDQWVPDEAWCRECYGERDEADFTDFQLVQEGAE